MFSFRRYRFVAETVPPPPSEGIESVSAVNDNNIITLIMKISNQGVCVCVICVWLFVSERVDEAPGDLSTGQMRTVHYYYFFFFCSGFFLLLHCLSLFKRCLWIDIAKTRRNNRNEPRIYYTHMWPSYFWTGNYIQVLYKYTIENNWLTYIRIAGIYH